jgi:hypothetical protein
VFFFLRSFVREWNFRNFCDENEDWLLCDIGWGLIAQKVNSVLAFGSYWIEVPVIGTVLGYFVRK